MTTRMDLHKAEAAAAAAKWWADRLRDGAGIGDNGARDPQNLMAQMLTRDLRKRAPITPALCDAYEQHLREAIRSALDSHNERSTRSGWDVDDPDVWLSVDYHPCKLLYEPLLAVGLDQGIASMAALPLKTSMRVSPRRVIVAHGYAARYVDVHGPVWGCSYAEQRAMDDKRYEIFKRSCEELWQRDVEARFGPDWSYPQLRDAGEPFGPDYSSWQGPV